MDLSNATYAMPFNMTSECFQYKTLSPFSPIGLVLFAIVYSAIGLAALIGNATVIVVLLWGEESSKTRNIRIYLLNLAICDIILTVFMPFNYSADVLTYWAFPGWTCGVPHYAQRMMVFNASATLTIIGFERYIVTVYPFSQICRWLKSGFHSIILVGSLWVIGAIYAYFVFERPRIYPFPYNKLVYLACTPNREFTRNYFIWNFTVSFLIPMIMLIYSYGAIMRKLKTPNKTTQDYPVTYSVATSSVTINVKSSFRTKNRLRRISHAECELRRNNSAKTNTQRILFSVVLLYCICWTPFKLVKLLKYFRVLQYCSEEDYYRFTFISIGSYLLAMANCAVNPILYSFMSHKFRKDLGKMKDSACRKIGFLKDEICWV